MRGGRKVPGEAQIFPLSGHMPCSGEHLSQGRGPALLFGPGTLPFMCGAPITSLTSDNMQAGEGRHMPEVTQPLHRSMFKLAGLLSHQPTLQRPLAINGRAGEGKHHQAARDPRGSEFREGTGSREGRALTSSFCSVFLSSSILCCICFMA